MQPHQYLEKKDCFEFRNRIKFSLAAHNFIPVKQTQHPTSIANQNQQLIQYNLYRNVNKLKNIHIRSA